MKNNYLIQKFNNVSYHKRLGVKLIEYKTGKVKLHLPFKEENANFGSALHGGIPASLINISAHQLAMEGVEENADEYEFTIVHQDVQYLSAAMSEPVEATATLLRRGKELFFVSVDVLKQQNAFVARGMVTVRRVHRDSKGKKIDPAVLKKEIFFPGPYKSCEMAAIFTGQGFIKDLGMQIEHMNNSIAIIKLPFKENLARMDGQFHEGAIAALMDTTGSMAAWASVSPGTHKASTPAMHVNFLAPARGEDVYALAKVCWQRNEIFLSKVHIVGANSGKVFAIGSVVYRIVI